MFPGPTDGSPILDSGCFARARSTSQTQNQMLVFRRIHLGPNQTQSNQARSLTSS